VKRGDRPLGATWKRGSATAEAAWRFIERYAPENRAWPDQRGCLIHAPIPEALVPGQSQGFHGAHPLAVWGAGASKTSPSATSITSLRHHGRAPGPQPPYAASLRRFQLLLKRPHRINRQRHQEAGRRRAAIGCSPTMSCARAAGGHAHLFGPFFLRSQASGG
jgi:hypothetical protein